MAEGFRIADAYVDVEAKYDDDQVTQAGTEAGEKAGAGFSRGADSTVRSDRGRFVRTTEEVFGAPAEREGDKHGRRWGTSIMRGAGKAVTGLAKGLFTDKITGALGGGLMSFVKSPVGIAAVGGLVGSLGAMIASGLASTLAVAFGSGLGLGFIGLGAFLLRDEKKVQKGLERIGKSFTRVFGGAAKRHFLAPIVTALGIINGLVKSLEPAINAIFKALAPAIVPLTRGLEGMIQNMMPGLIALMEVVGQTLGFEEPLMSLGAFLNEMFLGLAKNWPAIMASFFAFMEDVGAVLRVLGGIFIWLATNYEKIRDVFLGIVALSQPAITAIGALVGAFKYLVDNVPRWLSSAWGAISGFFTNMGATISRWWTAFTNAFSTAVSAVIDFVVGVGQWLGALPGRVAGWLMQLPGIVARAFTDVMHQGLYLIGFMIGSWLRFYRDLPGNIAAALSFLWGRMVGAWNTVRTNATNVTRATIDTVTRFFRELPGRAASAVSSLWSRMTGAFSSARTNASRGASNIVTGAVNILRQLPGKAASAISSVGSRIRGVFSGAGSWLVSAGKNIIMGIARGMKGALGAAVSTARSVAKSLLGGLTGALGISSPSKEAEKKVGRWIPPGIAQGFKKAMPAANRAMAAMAPDMTTGPVQATVAGSGAAGAAGAGGGLTIGTLTIQVPQGISDPKTWARSAVASLHRELDRYQKGYA